MATTAAIMGATTSTEDGKGKPVVKNNNRGRNNNNLCNNYTWKEKFIRADPNLLDTCVKPSAIDLKRLPISPTLTTLPRHKFKLNGILLVLQFLDI